MLIFTGRRSYIREGLGTNKRPQTGSWGRFLSNILRQIVHFYSCFLWRLLSFPRASVKEVTDFKKNFVQDDALLGKGFYLRIGDATLSRKRNCFKGMNYFNDALQPRYYAHFWYSFRPTETTFDRTKSHKFSFTCVSKTRPFSFPIFTLPA